MKSTQTKQKCVFIYVTIFMLLTLLLLPAISRAQTTVPFTIRYENTGINGELTIIGNSIMGNSSDTPYNGTLRNNDIDMVWVDIDGDDNTFNSSSANFTTNSCNRVVYAGLYWGTISAPSDPDPKFIKFKIPGGSYLDLEADENIDDDVYYKDVTSIVTGLTNPNGNYFVANLSSTQGYNASAGWSLVIVYEDPNESRKYISTFDGFSAVRNFPNQQVDFNYSGFTTPPSGPVEGKVGVVAMEGDLGLYGDQMQLRADANIDPLDSDANFTPLYDDANDVNNFFSSNITHDGVVVTNRNLNSSNTLGWDQKIVDFTNLNAGNSLIGNGETGATVRVRNNTGGDHIYTFLNTFSINIIEPVLQVITSVEDTDLNPITNMSPVPLGATVWYNINFQNIGTDNAQNTYIDNTLPINVTLDEASIVLPTGVTYTYNAATRLLRFFIDDALVERDLGTSYNIRYQVVASDNCFDYTDACTNLLENEISSYYDGETSGQNVSGQPGLNGINGCGLGNVGSMDLFVDTSSCQFDSTMTYCNNNLTISGHDGYNLYEWEDENGNDIGNTQEITVTGPGVYTVTQTKTGCTVTTRVITVLGLDVTVTPADALCKDSENGTIKVDINDTAQPYTYVLSKGGSTVSTVGPTTAESHTFTGLDIGTYSVRVTNDDGCFDVQEVTIGEPTLLQATNTVLDNIMPCNGNRLSGRIEVNATGGTPDYLYSINNGATYQSDNVFEVTEEGDHVITIKDANNCTTTTTATIDFDEEITYNTTKTDVTCYQGSDGKIGIELTSNTAGNTITYSIDGGATFQNSPNFSGLSVGDYEVIIKKVKGVNTCETSVPVSLVQTIHLGFTAAANFSCEGSFNQIVASVDPAYSNDVTYTLDGTTTSTTGLFEDVADGEHTVTVVNNSTGCSAEPVTVTVDAYTPVTFSIYNSGINEYTVNATGGEPGYEYAMNDETALGENNVFTIHSSGLFTFYVKDTKGCIVEQQIELEFIDIEIPNFFTPDGDGTNDTWYPRNIEIYPNITVTIFDRYQRLIAKFNGNQASWNGEYNNKLLPSGDYWYYVQLNEANDKRTFKGNFTLYR